MKSAVGAYNTKIFDKKDSILIPIWEVYIFDEVLLGRAIHNTSITERVMCLIIFDKNIKKISVIDAIKDILYSGLESYEDKNEKYRLCVISKNSLISDLCQDNKISNFEITDVDFVKDLEFEEVREMFGNKKLHPHLWKIGSLK